jgi:hypothetical protein
MAINVSFNGATIYKPGAYSRELIDLGGGFPLSPTGLIAIFGESLAGPPGSQVPDLSQNVFSPDQLPMIRSIYGSGPLVDACNFLFAPGADGALPGGAQAVYIYKTNASARASLAIASNFGTVQALEWGTGGNKITYKNVLVPASPASEASSATFDLSSGYFSGGVGAPHLNDAESQAAQVDAAAAYVSLAGLSFSTIPNVLDGQSLSAGNYTFAPGDVNLAQSGPGTLTLTGSASDVFVFKTPSTLTTGAGGMPTITLSGGVLASNVFWLIGSTATINVGTAGVFNGNIIATTSITDTMGGTVNGSMIALGAAVTLSAAAVVNAQMSSQLGAAASFGILASAAVTLFAGSVINGEVGSSPTGTVTGFSPGMILSAGGTLVLRLNGAATINTFTVPGPIVTRAALQAALSNGANWSGGLPSGINFIVGGLSEAAADLTISMVSSGNFELVSGSLLGSGNGRFNIPIGLVVSSSENQAMITLSNKRDLIDESGVVGGNVVLKLGRFGAGGVAPKVTINATQILLINNSVTEYSMNLADFGTVAQLVAFINSSTGGFWSAALGSTLFGQLPTSVLDKVTNLGAMSAYTGDMPAQIVKDAYEVAQFFAQSSMASLIQTSGQGIVGLPAAAAEQYLTGGTLGATSTADIANALSQFQAIRVNSVVPLFSRDAAADIIDGLTDGSSNYTILGIHQAVKTHLSLMATTKARSERQGYLSLKDTYLNCKIESQNLASSRCQLVIQDIRQVNSQGGLQWFMPWAGACLLAGARGGAPVGLPMTHKFFNMSGIRQTAQAMTTPEVQIVMDFNPGTQYEDAIQNGITFWEHPQTGGFRLVVDNTTYGADGNWVFNRAHVQYAADVLQYDFRNQLEALYIGVKNTVSAAAVKSSCDSILTGYLAQGITVSTSDAPNGYKQLVVQIVGNTINISVVVKLVEGIDFVLATITLQRATSTA